MSCVRSLYVKYIVIGVTNPPLVVKSKPRPSKCCNPMRNASKEDTNLSHVNELEIGGKTSVFYLKIFLARIHDDYANDAEVANHFLAGPLENCPVERSNHKENSIEKDTNSTRNTPKMSSTLRCSNIILIFEYRFMIF